MKSSARLIQKICFVVLFALALGYPLRGQQVKVPAKLVAYPDLILYNGKIVTMNDYSLDDSVGTIVQAIAVRKGRIQFLGSNDEILSYAGPNTKKIDLKGHTVTPGMIDTHNHIHNQIMAQWIMDNPAKVDTVAKRFAIQGKTYAQLTKGIELAVKEQMAHPLPGQWAMIELPAGGAGTGIGVDYLANKRMTRAKLDKLAPNLPVFINAHPFELWNTAGRNSILKFYKLALTDENEKAIPLSLLDRTWITEQYFRTHLSELENILQRKLQKQAAGGFTTYSSHIIGFPFMPAFRRMSQTGRMPMRFAFSHAFCIEVEKDVPGCFLRVGDWAGLGNNYFWNVGLSLMAVDSGPPSFCSTMKGPAKYTSRELCLTNPGSPYREAIETALDNDYRYVVTHVYGDKAVDQVMDAMEDVIKRNPGMTLDKMRALHVTADHCGFWPRPDQLPRIKKLGMILSCGAQYIDRSSPWLEVYGHRYENWIVPVRSIIKAGIPVTAELSALEYGEGSGPTPTAYLSLLITRKTSRGESIAPQEAVNRATVMKMATDWASEYVLKKKGFGKFGTG